MSFEDKELAFWKHKILEREQRRVEDERRTMEWARENKIFDYKMDDEEFRNFRHTNVWLDSDFEVTNVNFKKGEGEYQLSEYTSDYDHDVYEIKITWLNGPQVGKNTHYYFTLYEDEEFGSLVAEAIHFTIGE